MRTKWIVALSILLVLGAAAAPAESPWRFQTLDVPGAANTYAGGINARGEVHGSIDNAGFVLRRGQFDLYVAPDPLASYVFGTGISATGVSTGYYVTPDECVGCPWFMGGSWHAFVTRAGEFKEVKVPGSWYTSTAGVNARGDVVGEFMLQTGKAYGFLLKDGVLTTLDNSGKPDDPMFWSSALGINDAGDIVGWYGDGSIWAFHGYLLRDGVLTTIDVPGAVMTLSAGVNDRREVVGYYFDENWVQHGYVWRDGKVETVDPPGATYTYCTSINLAGTIVGYYGTADGRTHGFVAKK